jgi:hypothetical protein
VICKITNENRIENLEKLEEKIFHQSIRMMYLKFMLMMLGATTAVFLALLTLSALHSLFLAAIS